MIVDIYLRKSRADMDAEARGEGETLARHRTVLMKLAKQRKLTIRNIYSEIVSGDTIADRPQMQLLLRDVEQGNVDAVLCMDIDRLGRGDGADQSRIMKTLKYSGTIVITPSKTYDPRSDLDEQFLEMMQFIARGEYRRIKQRMWAGRCAAVAEGKWISPKAPIGYRKARTADNSGWTLEPDPDTRHIVEMIYDRYTTEHAGMRSIANTLTRMGYRTTEGNQFSSTHVRSILSNPVYVGKIRWCNRQHFKRIENGEEVSRCEMSDAVMVHEGLHEGIIPQEVFDAAQHRLRQKDPHTKQNVELTNPLAGILICAECGKVIQPRSVSSVKKKSQYCCNTYGCPTSSISTAIVMDAVIETLRSWIPDSNIEHIPQKDACESERQTMTQLETQMDDLIAKRKRLCDFLESGVYSVDLFRERSDALEAQITGTQSAIDELTHRIAASESAELLPIRVKHVLDLLPSSTPAEQNRLLKTVLAKIVYHKTHRCAKNENPADFLTLDIYPVL